VGYLLRATLLKHQNRSETDIKHNNSKGMLKVLGIDLTKQCFLLHGVDERGHTILKKKLTRKQLRAFITNLSPYLIGLEA